VDIKALIDFIPFNMKSAEIITKKLEQDRLNLEDCWCWSSDNQAAMAHVQQQIFISELMRVTR
jgi:hypothetical protein